MPKRKLDERQKLLIEFASLKGSINRNKGRYETTKNKEEKENYFKLWKDAEKKLIDISDKYKKLEKEKSEVKEEKKETKTKRKYTRKTPIKREEKEEKEEKEYKEEKKEPVKQRKMNLDIDPEALKRAMRNDMFRYKEMLKKYNVSKLTKAMKLELKILFNKELGKSIDNLEVSDTEEEEEDEEEDEEDEDDDDYEYFTPPSKKSNIDIKSMKDFINNAISKTKENQNKRLSDKKMAEELMNAIEKKISKSKSKKKRKEPLEKIPVFKKSLFNKIKKSNIDIKSMKDFIDNAMSKTKENQNKSLSDKKMAEELMKKIEKKISKSKKKRKEPLEKIPVFKKSLFNKIKKSNIDIKSMKDFIDNAMSKTKENQNKSLSDKKMAEELMKKIEKKISKSKSKKQTIKISEHPKKIEDYTKQQLYKFLMAIKYRHTYKLSGQPKEQLYNYFKDILKSNKFDNIEDLLNIKKVKKEKKVKIKEEIKEPIFKKSLFKKIIKEKPNLKEMKSFLDNIMSDSKYKNESSQRDKNYVEALTKSFNKKVEKSKEKPKEQSKRNQKKRQQRNRKKLRDKISKVLDLEKYDIKPQEQKLLTYAPNIIIPKKLMENYIIHVKNIPKVETQKLLTYVEPSLTDEEFNKYLDEAYDKLLEEEKKGDIKEVRSVEKIIEELEYLIKIEKESNIKNQQARMDRNYGKELIDNIDNMIIKHNKKKREKGKLLDIYNEKQYKKQRQIQINNYKKRKNEKLKKRKSKSKK